MKGMTILSMMAWTTNEKLDADEEEKVYAETRAMRTEEQSQRKNRKDIKTSPANWSKLKYLVNTYVIMLQALFLSFVPTTSRCGH